VTEKDPGQAIVSSSAPSIVSGIPADRRSRGVQHVRTAAHALGNWWKAMSIRALAVAVLWFVGLKLLHVALAPVWSLVAGFMTFVPHFGGVFSVMGPVFSVLVSGHDMLRLAYVLGLYAIIVVIDQLLLQPLLMKKVTRVPIWLSILAPIVLGLIIPFWGVLLAPPLLAVVYAFKKPKSSALPE
jgi:predicted PurR-regulated permease PerM